MHTLQLNTHFYLEGNSIKHIGSIRSVESDLKRKDKYKKRAKITGRNNNSHNSTPKQFRVTKITSLRKNISAHVVSAIHINITVGEIEM